MIRRGPHFLRTVLIFEIRRWDKSAIDDHRSAIDDERSAIDDERSDIDDERSAYPNFNQCTLISSFQKWVKYLQNEYNPHKMKITGHKKWIFRRVKKYTFSDK